MNEFQYESSGRVSRDKLILEGACSHCAHCGQPLTDSVSHERGIGPICSKKGYNEDPKDPDEIQAFIHLSPYPDLVQTLLTKIGPPESPNRMRKLMNELVRICSLNRKSPVHRDVCDAIDALGYWKLASTLRECIHTVEIKELKEYPDHFAVKTKYERINFDFNSRIRQLSGLPFSRAAKAFLVPKKNSDGLPNNKNVWNTAVEFYEGEIVKTSRGSFKLSKEMDCPILRH